MAAGSRGWASSRDPHERLLFICPLLQRILYVYIKKTPKPNPNLQNAAVEVEGKPPVLPACPRRQRGQARRLEQDVQSLAEDEGARGGDPLRAGGRSRVWQQSGAGQGQAPGSGPGILGPARRQRYLLQSQGARGDGQCEETWVLPYPRGMEAPKNMGVSHLLAWVY